MFEVEGEMIVLDSAHAIEHPDDIARILVNAGNPPTRLAVEQQELEDHFLQLTSGISQETRLESGERTAR
jgi:hypothetical protein